MVWYEETIRRCPPGSAAPLSVELARKVLRPAGVLNNESQFREGGEEMKQAFTIRRSRSVLCGCFATALVLVAPAVARADVDVVSDWNAIAQAETIPLRPTALGETRG